MKRDTRKLTYKIHVPCNYAQFTVKPIFKPDILADYLPKDQYAIIANQILESGKWYIEAILEKDKPIF